MSVIQREGACSRPAGHPAEAHCERQRDAPSCPATFAGTVALIGCTYLANARQLAVGSDGMALVNQAQPESALSVISFCQTVRRQGRIRGYISAIYGRFHKASYEASTAGSIRHASLDFIADLACLLCTMKSLRKVC